MKSTTAEIDELAVRYRDLGECSEELLDAHSCILWDYVDFLRTYDDNKAQLKEFGTLVHLLRKRGGNLHLNLIRTILVRMYSKQDMFNEMVIVFLRLARKWIKKEGISFSWYINAYMPFSVKRWIDNVCGDALSNIGINSQEVIPDSPVDPDMVSESDAKFVLRSNHKMFNNLTHQERYIVYMKYTEGLTDTEAGQRIGAHRTTVGEIRAGAVAKIKENIANND